MGKGPIIEFDLERGIAIEQLSQRDGPFVSTARLFAMCIVGMRAAMSIMGRGA